MGEQILDDGPALQDLRVFWHPWNPGKRKNISLKHVRILERMARVSHRTPWIDYYLGEFSDAPFNFNPLASFLGRRYGWMQFKVAHKYLMWSQFERALSEFELALQYKPLDWRMHGFCAETYLCLGRRREAFEELDRANSVVPVEEANQVVAWRGVLHLWLGDYVLALRELIEARNQGSLWSYCWGAGAKIKLGRFKEALEDLDEAIRLCPGDREAYVWRGEAKRELGLHGEALKDLNGEPVSFWSLLNRALVKAALKDYRGMKLDFFKIPVAKLNYLKKKLNFDLNQQLRVEEMQSVLRAGLDLSHGYRRNSEYGNAIWMV